MYICFLLNCNYLQLKLMIDGINCIKLYKQNQNNTSFIQMHTFIFFTVCLNSLPSFFVPRDTYFNSATCLRMCFC